MPARCRQGVWWRFLVLTAVLWMALLPAAPTVHAADAAASPTDTVSAREVDRLIKTLEDDDARARLVSQLKALRTAQQKQDEAATGLASKALSALSDRIEALGEQALAASNALTDAPRLADWLDLQISNDRLRHRWIDTLTKLLGLLAAGLALERIAVLLLRGPQVRLGGCTPATALGRLPLVVAWGMLELVPVFAFMLAVYGFLPVLGLKDDALKAANLVINAYVVARLAMIAAHIVLMPLAGGLRLPPLGEETARYLTVWSRRLIGVSVYGWIILGAGRLLGLPKSGYEFLLKLLGLLVTVLVVMLILQNRQPVAQWLRRRGDGRLGPRLSQVRDRLASVWHVLAVLYIVAIFLIWALRIEGGFDYVVEASLWTAAVLAGAALLSGLLRRLISRAFAVSQDLKQNHPNLERRANTYLPILRWTLHGLLVAVTVAAVLQAWGIDAMLWLATPWGRRTVSGLVTIALVLVIALVVWEVVSSAIERYLSATGVDGTAVERSARTRTLLPLLRNALMVVLVIGVGLTVLSELGVNVAPLLAGAGVVGLAIGFGSQKMVQDLITGAFMLFEDTIAVGDIVKIGEHAGVVEALSIRTIRLRDMAGTVHTIPFSAVNTIQNMTKGFSFAVFDVGVGYRENTDEVVAVLKQLGAELRADGELGPLILEDLEVLGVDRFGASEVVIKARIKTVPSKQWQIRREYNRRMKQRFDELGIEIPFPQTTLSFARDKQGNAAALPLRMDTALPSRMDGAPSHRGGPRQPAEPAHGAVVDLPTDHEAGMRKDDPEENDR